jgi:hypothetical protein
MLLEKARSLAEWEAPERSSLTNITLGLEWSARDKQFKTFSQWNSALKNVNNYLNTNIHSYLETSGVQSYNLYLNVAHFFNISVN